MKHMMKKVLAGTLLALGVTFGGLMTGDVPCAQAQTVSVYESDALLSGAQYKYADMLGAWMVIEHLDENEKASPIGENEWDTKVIFTAEGTADWVEQVNADYTDRQNGIAIEIMRPAPDVMHADWCAHIARGTGEDALHYYFVVEDATHLRMYRASQYSNGIFPAERFRIF